VALRPMPTRRKKTMIWASRFLRQRPWVKVTRPGHVMATWPINYLCFCLCLQILRIKRPVFQSVEIWEWIAFFIFFTLISHMFAKRFTKTSGKYGGGGGARKHTKSSLSNGCDSTSILMWG
jgi:hypothetical protein